MKNKIILLAAMAMLLSPVGLFAQEKTQTPTKFKLYGFFRNLTAFDTRDSYAGTQDLFYFAPKDIVIGADGDDLNANPSFRSLALTTRLGLDYSGYQYGATKVTGKVEADFYSMNSATAIFRLRQAYADFSWSNLGEDKSNSASIRVGQTWHPLAVDLPLVISLESGSPFSPFSRTPQILGNYNLGKNVTLTAGFLFQMQYLSTGPNGTSTEYLKYGLLPEIYAGVTVKNDNGFLAKAGVDILSIRPRIKTELKKMVNERFTTATPFVYLQYMKGKFQFKAKSTFASAGERLNFRSGYGISQINGDGTWEYTPMRSSATVVSASYGKKWQVMGMIGYLKQLGTTEDLVDPSLYWCSNGSYKNLNQLVRFTPTIQYTVGKIQIALEYNVTSAQYGSNEMGKNGLCEKDLHWVTNHRILTMLKFNF